MYVGSAHSSHLECYGISPAILSLPHSLDSRQSLFPAVSFLGFFRRVMSY